MIETVSSMLASHKYEDLADFFKANPAAKDDPGIYLVLKFHFMNQKVTVWWLNIEQELVDYHEDRDENGELVEWGTRTEHYGYDFTESFSEYHCKEQIPWDVFVKSLGYKTDEFTPNFINKILLGVLEFTATADDQYGEFISFFTINREAPYTVYYNCIQYSTGDSFYTGHDKWSYAAFFHNIESCDRNIQYINSHSSQNRMYSFSKDERPKWEGLWDYCGFYPWEGYFDYMGENRKRTLTAGSTLASLEFHGWLRTEE